jgi:peptide/nickel transport system substrate-binding protein
VSVYKIAKDNELIDLLFKRELSRRQLLIAAGGLSLAGILAACASSSSTTRVSVDTLTAGVSSLGPQSIDPHYSNQIVDNVPVWYLTTEMLVRRDLNNKFVANLATDWKISADGLTWTFALRSGVKMHDGSTFTARDVATAIKRVKDPFFSPYVTFSPAIANVNVIDDSHVAITTKTPYVTMLDDLPVPIPTDYYNRVGEAEFRLRPMAAGPFTVVAQAVNDRITFQRFPNYFDSRNAPNFKNFILTIVPEESTRVAGLQTGSLDLISSLSAASVLQLKGAKGIRVLKNPDTSIPFIEFYQQSPKNQYYNPKSPILDVRVRQALLMALDRQAISKALYNGDAQPAANLSIPATVGNDPKLKPYPYDPTKAKQLLKDAGASNLSWVLNSQTSNIGIPNLQELCQAMVSYWQAVGVKTEYRPLDPAVFSKLAINNQMEGARLVSASGPSLFEPGHLPDTQLLSTARAPAANDPKLDDLVRRIDATVDIVERTKLGMQYEDYQYETLPTLPIITLPTYVAIGTNVGEWTPRRNSSEFGPFWDLRS